VPACLGACLRGCRVVVCAMRLRHSLPVCIGLCGRTELLCALTQGVGVDMGGPFGSYKALGTKHMRDAEID